MSDFFTQTSNDPYLRHNYKLVFKNNKFKIFDNYHDLLQKWFNSQKDDLQFVEILDIPENRVGKKGSK